MTTDPTAEDLTRDLRADLELCEAATQGPWVPDTDSPPDYMVWGSGSTIVAAQIASTDADADARFIAAARTGWPAALRRAMAAERSSAAWHALTQEMQYQCDVSNQERDAARRGRAQARRSAKRLDTERLERIAGLAAELEATQRHAAQLEAELARLTRTSTCGSCGHRIEDEDPARRLRAMGEHIMVCAAHPLQRVTTLLDVAEAELAATQRHAAQMEADRDAALAEAERMRPVLEVAMRWYRCGVRDAGPEDTDELLTCACAVYCGDREPGEPDPADDWNPVPQCHGPDEPAPADAEGQT